jgi:hypothetical protein
MLNVNELEWPVKLALKIIIENRKEKSYWEAYLKTLPSPRDDDDAGDDDDGDEHDDDDDLNEIGGTNSDTRITGLVDNPNFRMSSDIPDQIVEKGSLSRSLPVHWKKEALKMLEKVAPNVYQEAKRAKLWRAYSWNEINEKQLKSNIPVGLLYVYI